MANLGHPGNWDAKSIVDVPRSSPPLLIGLCTGITIAASRSRRHKMENAGVYLSFSPLVHAQALRLPRHPRISPSTRLRARDADPERQTVPSCTLIGEQCL